MATSYKKFLYSDIANAMTPLHEAIPLTGTIISGTYGDFHAENNIKNYTHGMFQSVYDYPYLSSSANHVLDLSVGYSPKSTLSSSTSNQNDKKINIYNQMAQVLVGYDSTGSVLRFDPSGSINGAGNKMNEVIFVNFARLLSKDEIKKESMEMKVAVSASWDSGSATDRTEHRDLITITDSGALNNYFVNSPAGEYGILYATGGNTRGDFKAGLLFYQAGIAVLTASIFQGDGNEPALSANCDMGGTGTLKNDTIRQILTSSLISQSCDDIRHRINNISFNNTTELNSTIYFCRVNHDEYNYSSNPTYLTGSKIRVKGNNRRNQPVSYVTTIGLYSADRELLAVAKLSEPLKKDPSNEYTLRVRLDY